ncbi:liprin-alpha-2-like isoform X1 [Labeo rohita]|uniref:Liprin-alpha-2-like isoform X1 n=1 Tax=Labeo rohita TaxID=84645 RepID=A0A498LEA0_LABRO|nr:liprin-alpha-2-like isoform X1 [Labeo rohita]
MMCEVMPTINEGDSVSSQRGSQNGTDAESNFEQLMVNMLDERDKLLESLRETQETLIQSQTKLQDVLHERDVLQRQLNSALPQVLEIHQHCVIDYECIGNAEHDDSIDDGDDT